MRLQVIFWGSVEKDLTMRDSCPNRFISKCSRSFLTGLKAVVALDTSWRTLKVRRQKMCKQVEVEYDWSNLVRLDRMVQSNRFVCISLGDRL